MKSTKLSRLARLEDNQRETLEQHALTTVEELLGSCRREESHQTFARLLGITVSSLRLILGEGRELVDPVFLEELAKPVRRHKRGARIPPNRVPG